MKPRLLIMPENISNRWWAEISIYPKKGERVIVSREKFCSVICRSNTRNTEIGAFRSFKHALEFCRLNELMVVLDTGRAVHLSHSEIEILVRTTGKS